DLHLGKLWEILRYRIGERELAFFGENHCRDRRERLRHRVETEDRVFRHRRASLRIALSERFEVRHLALARHDENSAGQSTTCDLGLDHLSDTLQTLRRKTDVLRLRSRQRRLRPPRRDERDENGSEQDCTSLHRRLPWPCIFTL